ncbi:MAG: response regulator, partial [Planctomycetota bacterium]
LGEDNPINQKLTARILEKQGHRVVAAGNGKEVLERLEVEEFDVILMDVQMPDMNGLEATRIIRKNEKDSGKHIPIIALTAHAMKGDREKCLAAGMDRYLAKPIQFGMIFQEMYDLVCSQSGREPVQQGEQHASDERRALDDPDSDAIRSESPARVRTEKTFDEIELMGRLSGDVELLDEILQDLIVNVAKQLSDIRDAIDSRNGEGLRIAAHTLKGAVGNFAAKSAFDAALNLEMIGRHERWDRAVDAMAELAEKMTELERALTVFVEENKSCES